MLLSTAHLETRPRGRTARLEKCWNHLLEIRKMLVRGEEDLAKDATFGLLGVLSLDADSSSRRLVVHCHEILRDIGDEPFHVLEDRGSRILRYWAAQREHLHTAASLLSLTNFYRSNIDTAPDKNFIQAVRLVQGANHIARGLCRKYDERASKLILHQSMLWRHRLVAVHARAPNEAEADLVRLGSLAEEIGAPNVWIETCREQAAHATVIRDFDQAASRLSRVHDHWEDLPFDCPGVRMSVLHGEIDLMLASGRREADARLESLLTLAEKHPSAYYSRLFEDWQGTQASQPEADESEAVHTLSAFLPSLYFGNELVQL